MPKGEHEENGIRYLNCNVSNGMFRDEYAVTYKLSSGLEDSLYVDESDLKFPNGHPNGKAVPGLLRVRILSHSGDLVLVDLPREGFVHGLRVNVPEADLALA